MLFSVVNVRLLDFSSSFIDSLRQRQTQENVIDAGSFDDHGWCPVICHLFLILFYLVTGKLTTTELTYFSHATHLLVMCQNYVCLSLKSLDCPVELFKKSRCEGQQYLQNPFHVKISTSKYFSAHMRIFMLFFSC